MTQTHTHKLGTLLGLLVLCGTAAAGTFPQTEVKQPSLANGRFGLARYNSTNGTLDPTFGGAGETLTDIASSSDEHVNAVTKVGTKVVAVGCATVAGTSQFAVARYNANGTLDTTFGGTGIVLTSMGSNACAYAVTQQGTKIVVAGTGDNEFALARYNDDGTLDTTFATTCVEAPPCTPSPCRKCIGAASGKAFISFSEGSAEVRGLAVAPDGKIIAVGSAGMGFAMVRYGPPSLDSTFGSDGRVVTTFPVAAAPPNTGYRWVKSEARSVLIDPAGRILVGGYAMHGWGFEVWDSFFTHFALARYDASGKLDTTFDGDGRVDSDLSTGNEGILALSMQGSNILAAGWADNSFAVARYNSTGKLDPTFNTAKDGIVVTPFLPPYASSGGVTAVTFTADSKIVAAGVAHYGTPSDFFVVSRYAINGARDTSFGVVGTTTTDFASTPGESAAAITIDSVGKIVTAGEAGSY